MKRNLLYIGLLLIGLLIGHSVCASVRIERSQYNQPISCLKGDINLVLYRAQSCMQYSTYDLNLTNSKINRMQHYCYEGSLAKYQCSGYKIIINTLNY